MSGGSRTPHGNMREAGLRRLAADAPDLHARVVAGELSVHAAMVQAGLRPRWVSIRPADPQYTARSLLRTMRPDDVRVLVRLLNAGPRAQPQDRHPRIR